MTLPGRGGIPLATKEIAMRGLDEPSLADALTAQDRYPAYREWRQSGDVQEGIRAFTAKRPPVWQGK